VSDTALVEPASLRQVQVTGVAYSEIEGRALNNATNPAGMNLPGLRLHPLRGERRGQWAVSVSGNWRVVFEFDGPDATDVDLLDYH
jgi:proteic killer suppression protein